MTGQSRARPILAAAVLAVAAGALLLLSSSRHGRPGGAGTRRGEAAEPATVRIRPAGLMGTESELAVVVPADRPGRARAALARAEGRLRDVEALMSVHLASSELSRLNAAAAGETVRISGELSALLARAGRLAAETDGAFDATCRPLLSLWKRAVRTGLPPAQAEIDQARKLMGMRHLRLRASEAAKGLAGVEVDLGGLAKGHAVDRAMDILRDVEGATGQLVNVGGDLRCAGRNDRGRPWGVAIRHPFRRGGSCGLLELTDAAVATSGDYFRGFDVAERRYSHIVDPRTGRPVADTPSVTVVSLPAAGRAPSAAEADAWATALSVLGPAGLAKLAGRADLEAMIVTGTPKAHKVHMTAGFAGLLRPGSRIDLD